MSTVPISRYRPPRCKVILVGSSGVGKTCLVSSIFNLPWSDEQRVTTVASYSIKKVTTPDGTELDIEFWDTAGQEEYKSVIPLYFRDANVALLCSDSEHTFSVVEWCELIRNHQPEVPIIGVFTKCDLVDLDQHHVISNEILDHGKDSGISDVVITSAKEGIGIQIIFDKILEISLQRHKQREVQSPLGQSLSFKNTQSCC